jgi:P4 family phage/plasmid primase-like protien
VDKIENPGGKDQGIHKTNSNLNVIIHPASAGGQAQPKDESDLWDFDDAEVHIEKQRGRDLTSSQRLELIQDILVNSAFDDLQMSIIRDLLKSVTGITKSAMDSFVKACGGGSGDDDKDDRTHSELSAAFISENLPDDPNKRVGCEGHLWVYNDDTGIFDAIPLPSLEIELGDKFQGSTCRRGSDYRAIAWLVYNRILDENFFLDAPRGLPGANRFYPVDKKGVRKFKYTPELRQRFKLDYDPEPKCPTPMFNKFLDDCFPDDNTQKMLIQEVFGALLTGMAARLQVAFFLYGPGANGKSVMLEILDGLVSSMLKCSVKPELFCHEYYRAELAGKLINIVGEIDKDKRLTADFKDVVGCDVPVMARLPYKTPFRFTPQCGHVFAGNSFPQTRDHSYGQYRRWKYIHFKYTVAVGNRIPDLAKQILKSETPGILYWALKGAKQLIDQKYQLTDTKENDLLIKQWKMAGDSIEGFLSDDDFVVIGPIERVLRTKAFEDYRNYCLSSGVRPIGRNKFYERVEDRFEIVKPKAQPREYVGFTTLTTDFHI